MSEDLEARRARYCKDICGSKCCTATYPDEPIPIRCPNLSQDGSCGIYERRYSGSQADESIVLVGTFRSRRYRTVGGGVVRRPFYCGKIEEILAAGKLPKAIADQCVYAHPELLDQEQIANDPT